MSGRESPRIRRLRTDLRALETLRDESTILDFVAPGNLYGGLPESYTIRFYGRGLWRPDGSSDVLLRDRHEVAVTLGASYPRMQPELQWKTPIFHPNVSAGGVVCLGGYQTHWVPSVNLDDLCTMLWDMIRYANFDIESPYNREAAQWVRSQSQFTFPLDDRPIRDRVAAGYSRPSVAAPPTPAEPEVVFLEGAAEDEEVIDAEVVDAEVVEPSEVEPAVAGPSSQRGAFPTQTTSGASDNGNSRNDGRHEGPSSPFRSYREEADPSRSTAGDPEDPDILFIE